MALKPLILGPNFVPHFYPGGGKVFAFLGLDPGDKPSPEDWIGSATSRFGLAPAGITRLPDGELLSDAIAGDPQGWLGPDHVAAYGSDPGLLVKLLDSSRRLIVHCHPSRDFARTHLGCAHGKTEAWIIVSADPGAEVFVGFRDEVPEAQLADWVTGQKVDQMLESLNRLPATEGQAVLVPAGVPHAVGAGILILELQEPTDFSVMLEGGTATTGELGLGWDVTLGCVDRSSWSAGRVERLMGTGTAAEGSMLPEVADPFFRAQLVRAGTGDPVLVDPGLAVLVVLGGDGELIGDFEGPPLPMSRGTTILVPYGAGTLSAVGSVELVACRPPRPDSPQASRPEV